MSRNQREGKFIPGWCYNPGYKLNKKTKAYGVSRRAGLHYNVKGYRNFHDGWETIPGITFVRTLREGAYQ